MKKVFVHKSPPLSPLFKPNSSTPNPQAASHSSIFFPYFWNFFFCFFKA